jgi:hypothetical protein
MNRKTFGNKFSYLFYYAAMVGQMFGKRPVEKPRKRWFDAVKEDSYQMLKWRDWEVRAQDREEWKSRIKKAKVCFGLQCH